LDDRGGESFSSKPRFYSSQATEKILLEFKRTSDAIGAWIEDNCTFDVEGFISRKEAFEDYKNYADEELGKTPETERRFYQRLRDTPKVKDHNSHQEGRGFKGIRLKKPDDKPLKETQTQLISAAVVAVATDNFNSPKNLSSANHKFALYKNLLYLLLRCGIKTALITLAILLRHFSLEPIAHLQLIVVGCFSFR